MLRVIRNQGREFVQTYNIEYKDANGVAKSGFVNLGPNGFLHEFGDEQDAKKLYEKLRKLIIEKVGINKVDEINKMFFRNEENE